MEYSPTLCFTCFECRRSKSSKKRGINWLRQKCRDIISKCRDITSIEPAEAMLQQEMLCLEKVEDELKVRSELCRNISQLCRDIE